MWWLKNTKFPGLQDWLFTLNGSFGKKSFLWSSIKIHKNYPVFLSFSRKNILLHLNYSSLVFLKDAFCALSIMQNELRGPERCFSQSTCLLHKPEHLSSSFRTHSAGRKQTSTHAQWYMCTNTHTCICMPKINKLFLPKILEIIWQLPNYMCLIKCVFSIGRYMQLC